PFLKKSPPKKNAGPGFALVFDEIAIARAALDARFPARQRDTLIRISPFEARVRALRVNAPNTTLSIDTLGAGALLNDAPALELRLGGRAELTPSEFRVSHLRLDGDRTRVLADGALPLGGSDSEPYDGIAFHAQTRPLAGDEFQRVFGFAWNPGDLNATVDLK